MNCFIWILLLLGCCGNSCNASYNDNCGCSNCCNDYMNNCGCNDCGSNNCECNNCGNLIQPRMNDDCECRHHHHEHDCNGNDNRYGQKNDFMAPPPVPHRVRQDDDCGCND